jgi:hypothetical protein
MIRLLNKTTSLALLLVTLGAGALAQEKQAAPSIAGTWSMTVKGTGAHGDMAASLTLKQDGNKVTGVLNAHGQDRAVTGDFVNATLTLQTRDGEAAQQLALKATLKNELLSGYISGEMGDLRWTATRAKK